MQPNVNMANQRQADVISGLEAGSDEALLALIGSGDQAAFAQLIARHMGRVIGIGWRMTGSKADGEDIAQEAFARVWVGAAKWKSAEEGGSAKFGTWLYRVVMNLCIDRKRRRRDHPLEAAPEQVDESEGAESGMIEVQTAAAVAKAIASLPPRQRQAIVLCVYEEQSNIEAARIMGLSIGAVESLLVRARRTLKETLAPLAGS